MHIKSLKIKNFRNYTSANLDFFDGINLISGKNGQGKTNLVEPIMLFAMTKSPRTSHDEDLLKENEEVFEVELTLERLFGEVELKCIYSKESGKKFFVNGNEITKFGELLGNLVAVYFSPNDLIIVSGGPSERRDFLDYDLSMLSGNYYNLLQRYNKVLFQRNKLLKTCYDKEKLVSQIEVWNIQLAKLASLIIKTRRNFISKLSVPANEAIKNISKNADELKISYLSIVGENADEIEAKMLSLLQNNLEKDIELGYTSFGPHRDDIKFELNGHDAKIFASQGQQRSIVLALKLAEMKVFSESMGEMPILILDDVFSELDQTRQKKLYEMFDSSQVLMTGTNFKFKPSNEYLSVVVNEGQLKIKQK